MRLAQFVLSQPLVFLLHLPHPFVQYPQLLHSLLHGDLHSAVIWSLSLGHALNGFFHHLFCFSIIDLAALVDSEVFEINECLLKFAELDVLFLGQFF